MIMVGFNNICQDPNIGMEVFSLQKPFIDQRQDDFKIPCVLINSQAILAKEGIKSIMGFQK